MGFYNNFQHSCERAFRYLKERQKRVRAPRLEIDALHKGTYRLEPRLRELCENYRPELTQADLEAARQTYPAPTDELLRAEMLRIRAHLEPLTADWPLDTKFRLLKQTMQRVWGEMQGRLHVQVFGAMDLPSFYRIHHSFCSYEATVLRRDQFGQSRHIGFQSGHDYGQVKPILWRPLT
jgi:hypothetical protein